MPALIDEPAEETQKKEIMPKAYLRWGDGRAVIYVDHRTFVVKPEGENLVLEEVGQSFHVGMFLQPAEGGIEEADPGEHPFAEFIARMDTEAKKHSIFMAMRLILDDNITDVRGELIEDTEAELGETPGALPWLIKTYLDLPLLSRLKDTITTLPETGKVGEFRSALLAKLAA